MITTVPCPTPAWASEPYKITALNFQSSSVTYYFVIVNTNAYLQFYYRLDLRFIPDFEAAFYTILEQH